MSTDRAKAGTGLNLFVSPDDFFKESVRKAFAERKVEAYPHVETYLIKLLQHFLDARNFFDAEATDEFGQRKPKTLAELYLIATNSEHAKKIELLKKLADQSLYMSGFFGDSFDRKIIDVDYYAEMGGAAYRTLADCTREDTMAKVYGTFSQKFVQFMDVLAYISQNSFIQSNQSVLRLYDRYLRTGSELAREKLVEIGVFTLPLDQAKLTRQS